MKIAFLCDMHLPDSKNSPQYAFFCRALEQMKSDGIKTVVNLGDIDAFGEVAPLEDYFEKLSDFDSYYVFGNSEVRDEKTLEKVMTFKAEPCFKVGSRSFLGINTHYGEIDKNDRARLETLKDGDIAFLHHHLRSLKRESREFFENLLAKKALTVFHGHAHYYIDEIVGKSRVYGLRALDPDKSVGNYPCVTYAEITDEDVTLEEKLFGVSDQAIIDLRNHLGMSCVNNQNDITYAIENGVKNLEIRCRNLKEVDYSAIPLVKKWRETCGEYLSLHMPDIKCVNGEFSGEDKWYAALEFAKALGVNGITIHPPVAKRAEMKNKSVYDKFLGYYVDAVKFMGDSVKVGIENMHMSKGEVNDETCGFGFCPEEVAEWIDAMNEKLGNGRVGHTLDVGHARNNGIIASTNPVGRWYEKMGKRTVAYHIHQAIMEGGEMKNHRPIENWFGPMISYVSFLYAWETKMINNVPVFLEVKGAENFEKSIKGFKKDFFKES